jgi:hypothetical protein
VAFAPPAGSLAQDRQSAVATGKIKNGKVKRSEPLRAPPEARGGTLEAGKEIFF